MHFCYLRDGNKPGSAPAKFISCVSANATLYFWQKQIFIFSNTIRSFDHQMSAFVIDIYMCPACNVHSKSTKKRSSFVPFEVGAEWNFGNNLIVMQICKDNKMTTTEHFYTKILNLDQFQKCLLRGNQKMPPWRDWPS